MTMEIPSETEIRRNVADRADYCPGCEWEPDAQDVNRSEISYGDEYYGLRCKDCGQWEYEDDRQEWYKLTPPGEENPRVSRA